MKDNPVGRRFTEDEVRRIFGKAAEADVRQPGTSGRQGLSLEELHVIGEEVGLDREAVSRAAAVVITESLGSPARRFEPSTLVHEDAVIPRALTNAEMRNLVVHVEQIVGRQGLVTEAGPWVEWRDNKGGLYVGMVRGAHATHIRAIGNFSKEIVRGSIRLGIVSIFLVPAAASGGILGLAAGVAGAAGAVGAYWKWRTGRGRRNLRELVSVLSDLSAR